MTQTLESPPAAGSGNDQKQQLATRSKVQFQPLAPIGSAVALKSLLETQKASIAQMLPKHITPERLLKTLLVAVNRIPDILRCTQASILETINRAAELGLDLSGTLGEAYPVPFNNNVGTREKPQWLMQLSLIIGYRGMEKLAWQSGEVESIDAEVVRTKDKFIFRKGTEVFVEWCPSLEGDRGEVVGAYACVKLKSGGKLARFLPKSDIEKIRSSSKSKDSPAWRNWWDEMARKCALKRTLKDAPLSTEKFVRAMETDAEDFDGTNILEVETLARGNSAVLNKLKQQRGDAASAGADADTGEVLDDSQASSNPAQSSAAAPSHTDASATGGRDSSEAGTTGDVEPGAGQVKPDKESQDTGAGDDESQTLPTTIPPAARTSSAWIDNVIPQFKPEDMTTHAARKAFHAADAESWAKLGTERQQQKYTSLMDGSFVWKK